MENKIIIFRDERGYVELTGLVGSDMAVVNDATDLEMTDEAKNKIRHLVEQAQTETLEHCTLMFRIRAPLFVAREHMSMVGWNCNEPNKYYADANTKFYEPGAYREANQHGFNPSVINPVLQDKVKLGRFRVYRATKALSLFHESALRLYKHMLEAGICRQQAMAVLPQNVYVEYYATANLKTALRFANQVDDEKVLPELRTLADAVLQVTRNNFPITTEKWRESTKKRQTDVSQRLEKLGKLVSISENLFTSQVNRIKKVQTNLERKEETEGEIEERNIQEGGQGAGSPQVPKENRSKARWRFWQKNGRGSKKVPSSK